MSNLSTDQFYVFPPEPFQFVESLICIGWPIVLVIHILPAMKVFVYRYTSLFHLLLVVTPLLRQ